MSRNKGTVCLDFDGTIYSYKSGWGQGVLTDPILEGAKEAIAELKRNYKVVVFSVRANDPHGKQSIRDWLEKEGIEVDDVIGNKPNAFVFIDDRNIPFENNWSEMVSKVNNFETWQSRNLPAIKASEPDDCLGEMGDINEEN